MNLGIHVGNITKETEVRQTPDGLKVARNGMALNRGKDKNGNDRGADFINIVGFGHIADFMEKFCNKGRRFAIRDHVQTGSYEKDGRTIYTTDFVVDQIEFADSKPISQDAPKEVAPTDADGFMNIPDGIDEELPFN